MGWADCLGVKCDVLGWIDLTRLYSYSPTCTPSRSTSASLSTHRLVSSAAGQRFSEWQQKVRRLGSRFIHSTHLYLDFHVHNIWRGFSSFLNKVKHAQNYATNVVTLRLISLCWFRRPEYYKILGLCT